MESTFAIREPKPMTSSEWRQTLTAANL